MALIAAFQTPFLLANVRPSTRTRANRAATCTISNANTNNNSNIKDDGERVVRFRKESTEDALQSFKKTNSEQQRIATPNERLLKELEDSINELGLNEPNTAPPAEKMADYSHVKPWAAFAGSVGAGVIAVTLWYTLQGLVVAYSAHPLQSEFYVVQRMVAVVRTAVVGLLALASGISGVTSVGLLLLGSQVTYDSITSRNDGN